MGTVCFNVCPKGEGVGKKMNQGGRTLLPVRLDFCVQGAVFVVEMREHSNKCKLNFSDTAQLYLLIPLNLSSGSVFGKNVQFRKN